jgi:iron only hydrogenase large subunit-like protein
MACPGGCIGGGGQPYHHGEKYLGKPMSHRAHELLHTHYHSKDKA